MLVFVSRLLWWWARECFFDSAFPLGAGAFVE